MLYLLRHLARVVVLVVDSVEAEDLAASAVDLLAEAVLAEAGKSLQNTNSSFFPMDCFVPLQIP